MKRTFAILRRRLGEILGVSAVAVPAGLLLSFCGIGIPLLGYAFGRLVRAALLGAKAEAGQDGGSVTRKGAGPGVFALAGFAALVAGALSAASGAVHLWGAGLDASEQTALGVLSGLLAACALGAALAPLAFAPLLAADGVVGIFGPLSRSVELAARLGPGRAARLGAAAGALMGAGLALVSLLFLPGVGQPEPWSIALVAAPFGIIPGPPLTAALLADAYVRVRADEGEPARPDRAPAPRVRAIGWLLLPTVILLAVACLVAAATPTPMRRLDLDEPLPRGFQPGMGVAADGRVEARAGEALIRTVGRGIEITTRDGGGAGYVEAGFFTREAAVYVLPGGRRGGPEGSLAVIVTDGRRWARTLLTRDGVRLDDGLRARVLGRLGRPGMAAVALGAILLLVLTFTVGSELGEARALDAPAVGSVDGPAGRGRRLRALEGKLRLSEGSKATYRPARRWRVLLGLRTPGSTLRVDGEAWIEAGGGAQRVRLPEAAVPVFRGASGLSWDRRSVVLLSRALRPGSVGFREAADPWPDDGLLVLGSIDDAAAELTARASRVASVLATPILACFALATVWVLLAL